MFTCLKMIVIPPMVLALALLSMPASAYDEDTDAPTPLRLSYVKGDVSLMRAEEDGWEEARLNLPLVVGDMLETGSASALELQLGNRAFVRADANTRLRITGQDLHYIRFEVDSGRMSVDVRALPEDDYLIDVDAGGTLFTVEREGYYRVDVGRDQRFVVRQGGQAVLLAGEDGSLSLQSSEAAWLSDGNLAQAETGVAPTPDAWDRWNLDRTDDLIAATSARYLPADVAGAYDLDRYGSWRVTASYGPVWLPYTVASAWVPYSSGHWVWDPVYQWTWIDDAPWGWAPFHYGRWIYLGNRWAWVPGPVVRRAVYAPALVAFFHVGTYSTPRRCWVALGWGEPVVPWWGRSGFVGKPSWRGWGGPRMVNRTVVKTASVIQSGDIVYDNSRIHNALVAAPVEQFGRKDLKKSRLAAQSRPMLKPVQGGIAPQPLRARGEVSPSRTDEAQRWRKERGDRTESALPSRSTARTRGNQTATQRDDAVPHRAVPDKPSTRTQRKPVPALPLEQSPRSEGVVPERDAFPAIETVRRGARAARDAEAREEISRAVRAQQPARESRVMRDAEVNDAGRGGREERRDQQRIAEEQETRGERPLRSTPYGLTRDYGRLRSLQRPNEADGQNAPRAPVQSPESRWESRERSSQGDAFGTQ